MLCYGERTLRRDWVSPSHLERGSGLTPAHRVYDTPPKPALWRAELASCLIPVPNGQHSRSIFGVHGISPDASVQSVGRVPREIGGSDDLYLRHLSHGPIGCRGNLQSAGNASSPLYCRARHFCRALLSGTRGTSSSSPRLSKQADASPAEAEANKRSPDASLQAWR